MPLISLATQRTLRDYWPVVCAVVLFALFLAVDLLWYRPTAKRFETAVNNAVALGMPLDLNQMPPLMPPRVFALIGDNAMPAAQAQEAANSGTLTAQFLGDLVRLMGRRAIRAATTEPGPMTQDDYTVQVRAHVRLRCSYADYVLLLDDFATDQKLFGIDRFSLAPDASGQVNVELWMSRLILKMRRRT